VRLRELVGSKDEYKYNTSRISQSKRRGEVALGH